MYLVAGLLRFQQCEVEIMIEGHLDMLDQGFYRVVL